MSVWLRLLSGLFALAASGLVTFRVWTAAPMPLPVIAPAKPAAVYVPEPKLVKSGEVYESESAANGFILVIETVPDEAEVIIDGVSKGETPASLNFECVPPKTFALVIKKAGFKPIERTIACKRDTMVVLKARPEALRHH